MTAINHTIRGNSRAAIAGRAARAVRKANAWKVQAGLISKAGLRRWARSAAEMAARDPEAVAHWRGVVRFA